MPLPKKKIKEIRDRETKENPKQNFGPGEEPEIYETDPGARKKQMKNLSLGQTKIYAGAKQTDLAKKWVNFLNANKTLDRGKIGDQFWTDGNQAYSYETPIAQIRKKGNIILNHDNYSSTTSKLTDALEQEAKAQNMSVTSRPESYFDKH